MRRIIALAACAALLVSSLSLPSSAVISPNGSDTYACKQAPFYDASTNGATQLIAAGGSIVICGFNFWAAGTVNVGLVFGTGTNCATGTTKITPAYQLVTQTGVSDTATFFRGLYVPSGNALCINTSAGVAVQAIVYAQQ